MPKSSPKLKNPLSRLVWRQILDHLLFAVLTLFLLAVSSSFAPGTSAPETSTPPEDTVSASPAAEEAGAAEEGSEEGEEREEGEEEPQTESAAPELLPPAKGAGKASEALPASTALPPALVILPALLAFLLFAVSTYTNAWHTGERDINLVKYGHSPYRSLKGLWGGLWAQLPGAAFAVWACFGSLWGALGAKLYYAPYLWLFAIWDAPALYFLPALLHPLFAQWGYRNGYRFFSLYHKIVYKKSNGKKREKDQRLR
jgi:hypothetical protein